MQPWQTNRGALWFKGLRGSNHVYPRRIDGKLFIHVYYYRKAIPRLNIAKGVKIDNSEHKPIYY